MLMGEADPSPHGGQLPPSPGTRSPAWRRAAGRRRRCDRRMIHRPSPRSRAAFACRLPHRPPRSRGCGARRESRRAGSPTPGSRAPGGISSCESSSLAISAGTAAPRSSSSQARADSIALRPGCQCFSRFFGGADFSQSSSDVISYPRPLGADAGRGL